MVRIFLQKYYLRIMTFNNINIPFGIVNLWRLMKTSDTSKF